jgi:hypothetical protein
LAWVSTLGACAAPAAVAPAAQPPVGLGTAGAYAVLGASTVTNTGPSVVDGDLGVAPGTAIIGFPPGLLNGARHAADAASAQAQADLTAAYGDAAARTPPALLPADAGGLFLTAGVYRRASALGLTGDVTLDAQGDPDAVFVLQAGTLTAASDSRVQLAGRAQACKVFWLIESSATLGTDVAFAGTILAQQSITMNTRATLQGRALARSAAVTLDTNTIGVPACTTGGVASGPAANPGAPGATPPGPAPPGGGAGQPAAPGGSSAPPSATATPPDAGVAALATQPRSVGQTVARFGRSRCVDRTFRAVVTGVNIHHVTFFVDGRWVNTQDRAPFAATIRLHRGTHKLRARVTFTDATPSRNIGFRFRPCAQAKRAPPSFTG